MHEDRYNQESGAAGEAVGREIATLSEDAALDDAAVLRTVPDLRGVRVEDASGIPVGELYGALSEADTGLLRYVDLDLSTLDRHVLVPIGHTRVREEQRDRPCIRLRAALLEQLEQIPPFPADVAHIDDPFERALLEAYGRTFHGERYYAHPSYDHTGLFVGEHPVVADGADRMDVALSRLSYLSGWRVAAGEPDIRGWPLLLAGDGTRLDVTDLIVDTGAGSVRYVTVPTPDEQGARLVPVGFLRIDRDAKEVIADGLTASDITDLPPYAGGGVSRELEDRVGAALRRSFSGRRRYQLPDFRV